ncbi:hypothetical protein RJ639_030213 [Escallonia herrerae]|uniref:Iron-related transcription factor 3 bHLH domain-containing protein n=1 Tax=Escallonia herrerae TaxID=1293975 RepID=A0AA89BAY7_9ASTE|nr:hypothetical protein RJ639_030213 [Escallonia herrerae]
MCCRPSPRKRNHGRVPKRIHKAEREKLKRDHMNVLFLELGKSLARQNSGKSSTLSDTIRLLRDLLAQVDSLKRENAALLSECSYVTLEKDELKEDNFALEAQIGKLQNEIEERVHPRSSWRLDPSQSETKTTTPQLLEGGLMLPVVGPATEAASVVGSVFVVPLNGDPQLHPKSDTVSAEDVSKLPPTVSRPHARYPSSSDSWPSHILSKQPVANQNVQHSSSKSTSTSSSSSSSSSSRQE